MEYMNDENENGNDKVENNYCNDPIDSTDQYPLLSQSEEIRPIHQTQPKSLKSFMSSSTNSNQSTNVLTQSNLASSMDFSAMTQLSESELISSSVLLPEVTDVSSYFESHSNQNIHSSSKVTSIPILAGNKEESITYTPEEIFNLEWKVSSLQKEVKRLTDAWNISESDRLDIVANHKKMESQISKYKTEIFETNEKIAKLEQLKVIIAERNKTIDELKTDLDLVRHERDDVEKKFDKCRNELEICKTDLNKTKMEFSRLKSEMENLEQRRKDDLSRIDSDQEKRRQSTEQRLRDSEAEILRLDDQVNRLSSYINNRQLHKEINERIQAALKLNDDLSAMERHLSQLEAENIALRRKLTDIDGLESELHQRRRREALLEADLNDLSNDNTKLRTELLKLKGMLKAKQSIEDEYGGNRRQMYQPEETLPLPPPIRSSSYGIVERERSGSYNDNNSSNNNNGSTNMNPTRSLRSYDVSSSSTRDSLGIDYESTPMSRPSLSSYKSNEYSSRPSYISASNSTYSAYSDERSSYDTSPSINKSSSNNNSNNNNHGNNSSNIKSLATLVGSNSRNEASKPGVVGESVGGAANRRSSIGVVPFATEQSSEQMAYYDGLDRQLTTLTTEKSSLLEEAERLHQRGGKTLKERNRLNQVEHRLDVIGKEISILRKSLSAKPS